MSGGHFEYKQWHILDIVESIERVIDNGKGYAFSSAELDKFKEAVYTLKRGYVMAQRIDWLLSMDDGEESFHRRWKEDLDELERMTNGDRTASSGESETSHRDSGT